MSAMLNLVYHLPLSAQIESYMTSHGDIGVAMEVGRLLDNQDHQVEYLKETIEAIKGQIEHIEKEREQLLEAVAVVMQDNGIDKLAGAGLISSITIRSDRKKEELIIDNEELALELFPKVSLDKTALKNAIKEDFPKYEAYKCAHIETTPLGSIAKVNMKRITK